MEKEWRFSHSGGIQDYLMNRLQHNQSWYDEKQLLTHRTELSISSQAVFGLIYFVIMEQLKLGHTVLSLSDDKMIQGELNLTAWQSALVMPVITIIQESLNQQVNFQDLFCDIDQQHDFKSVKAYIGDVPKRLVDVFELVVHPPVSNAQKALYQQLIQWVLWFYYDSRYRLECSFERWVDEFSHHVLFGGVGSDRPIVYLYQGGRIHFWLHRSFYAEQKLLAYLHQISCVSVPSLVIDVNPKFNKEQLHAVHVMSHSALSIITGGPGTGKTFTVASVVKALLMTDNPNLALVAPTGKAAQRMKEALENSLGDNDESIKHLPEPMTIHRLLGIGKSGIPRHHATNPLPYELIIVDEASMLGVELAMWLLSAVKLGARLILLGDAYQLSAVDAGAVLADLCRLPQLQNVRAQLISSKRFDDGSGVGKLAKLINQPTQIAWKQFEGLICPENQLEFFDISAHNTKWFYDGLITPYKAYFDLAKQLKHSFYAMSKSEKIKAIAQLMTVFNQYRILTASHLSSCGDEMINKHIALNYQQNYLNHYMTNYHWYHGRPVMILKNRYDLGLYNGDIGICLQSGRHDNQLQVYFYDNNEIKSFNISVLGGDVVSTAYAMTIHKSQGSEFDKVAICFDKANERLLSKELIYTAVTRAKTSIEIYSTSQAILDAINKPTIRQTGLEILLEYYQDS
ncbi:exodeoxyribonuclease V subunit alpha [Moraxella oblonga]|uniref:exodeoxyribonuclease V subunit alpha n=1 Tax=Moraxella oblonga TaxID=200413 RepID=UPI00082C18C7|nr:exodeoxyribonuclease V subunit alpha [Moraxella oblonga]